MQYAHEVCHCSLVWAQGGQLAARHVTAICNLARLTHSELCLDGLETGAKVVLLHEVPRMLRLKELALLYVSEACSSANVARDIRYMTS